MEVNDRVLVVGAGYVGSAFAKECQSKGLKVYATTRSADKAKLLKEGGINPILFDFFNLDQYPSLPEVDYLLLCPAPSHGLSNGYEEIYHQGIKTFLSHYKKKNAVMKIIYTSSVGVYQEMGGEWVDESTPISGNTPRIQSLLKAEDMVLNWGIPAQVFRLAGIYGPERHHLLNLVLSDQPCPDPHDYLNLIHLDDIVQGLMFLFRKHLKQEIFLGVDTGPTQRINIYTWIAERLKIKLSCTAEDPSPMMRQVGNKRCSSKKLISLGYQFQCPTFREGYEKIFKIKNLI